MWDCSHVEAQLELEGDLMHMPGAVRGWLGDWDFSLHMVSHHSVV